MTTQSRPDRIKRLAARGGWIAVDLDGTLAHYDGWVSGAPIGKPIPRMLERVKRWLADGVEVRIFTARATEIAEVDKISVWVKQHVGQALVITNVKDKEMIELWDDRAVQVVQNTGFPVVSVDGE